MLDHLNSGFNNLTLKHLANLVINELIDLTVKYLVPVSLVHVMSCTDYKIYSPDLSALVVVIREFNELTVEENVILFNTTATVFYKGALFTTFAV